MSGMNVNIISVRQTNMSRPSIRSTINLIKDKPCETKPETSSSKTIAKTTTHNSLATSSSNSMANISISFLKDANFPKLFNQSPLLFSFNAQPSTTTHSSMRNSLGFSSGFSSGIRTPSSTYNSLNQGFQRDHFRKNSLFSKKSAQLTADIEKKRNQKKQRAKQPTSCSTKQNKHGAANTMPEPQVSIQSYESGPKMQSIRVFVRIKPCDSRDLCVKPYIMRIDEKHVEVEGKIMAYDHVFSNDCKQSEVFETIAKPILAGVFSGYNGTIFAYGQTGSGKTHTIFGGNTTESQGIISRSLKYIFEQATKDHKISLSLLQIYKEELIDLVVDSKNELKIKQTSSGVYVENLTRIGLKNISDTLDLIESSLKNRRVAATKLNEKSSRSHTILTIHVDSMEIQSKLCLIDLAGSQKANKAGVVGENFEEMKKINYSLSCLGNVINALVTRKKSDHIPFRDSKLTRLLKDSLSGKFRTSIIVNCSSDDGTEEETISSLKFADRAKKVKITISKCQSKGKQNVEYLHKVIQQLTTDLQNTKRELSKYKQTCAEKANQKEGRDEGKGWEAGKSRVHESPEVTARQTIPSERAHLDQQMKKYGKENKLINVVSLCQKQKKKLSINFSQISSLNVSKSTANILAEINSPSVSSLSYRPDDAIDDLSFNFSNFPREDQLPDRNA